MSIRLTCLLFAGLLMGQTARDFTKNYEAYLSAVKTGDYRNVLPLLSTELRQELKSAGDQKEFMTMQNYLAPATYETAFLTMPSRDKADLQVLATIKIPEDIQKEQKLPPTQRLELLLSFVQEGGQWKWNGSTVLGDPDKRSRPKDLNMGSRADYKEGSMEIGGQILRLEKQSAGTVFIVRILDEEIAAFVPSAVVSAELVPGRVVSLRGAEHKTEKLKLWAEQASVQQ